MQAIPAQLDNAGQRVGSKMIATLRYFWAVARGYRLKPWKSPYLLWRLETFLGAEASEMNARKFFDVAWEYRAQLRRFVAWAAERRRIQRRNES